MVQNNHSNGRRNPRAPVALSQFEFLLGEWRFDARFKSPDGEWQAFHGTWLGRYILDGYVIEDEYTMFDTNGKVIVRGLNFRVYDVAKKNWNIKWLSALDGTWTDLTPEALGGAKFEGPSVSYVFREPSGASAGWKSSYTRATYTSVSPALFTWSGEKSDDRESWSQFMLVECHRT